MPKYLIAANYVGEGIKGLLKDGGSGRRAAVERLLASVGGRMEAFYYAFGDTDLYMIADLPDHASVVGLALTASASGAVTVRTTVLLTPEEIDQAVKLTPGYTPPGR